MPAARSPSLIHDYSTLVTSLHDGKRALIDCGVDRVQLNRYVVDAAATTGQLDSSPILDSIDPAKVSQGDDLPAKREYCRQTLAQLVEIQEEITTLQKVARENGISTGLLNIVGQAANQSPDDHGASVIRQLHHLLNDDDSADTSLPSSSTSVNSVPDSFAANDSIDNQFERLSSLQKITALLREHWKPLLLDGVVCLLMSCVAINLVR